MFVLLLSGYLGKLDRLAVHPVANFVVARAIGRLNADQLRECLGELDSSWSKIISKLTLDSRKADLSIDLIQKLHELVS